MNRLAYSAPPMHFSPVANTVTGMEISADGRLLLTFGANGAELRTGEDFERILARIPGAVDTARLANDRVVAVMKSGVAETWTLDGARLGEFAIPPADGDKRTLTITADGRHLVTVSDSQVRVFDSTNGAAVSSFSAEMTGKPTLLSSDGDDLFFNDDGTLAVTDLKGKILATKEGWPHTVCAARGTRAACFGHTMTNGTGEMPTQLIGVDARGSVLPTGPDSDLEWSESSYDTIEEAAFDSTATWIIARSANNKVCRWSISDGRSLSEFNAALVLGNRAISSTALSDDGVRVALIADDGTAFIFNAETGALLSKFSTGNYVESAAWRPGHAELVLIRSDGRCELWQTERAATAKALLFGDGVERDLALTSDASVALARHGLHGTTREVAYSVRSLKQVGEAGAFDPGDERDHEKEMDALDRSVDLSRKNAIWERARQKFPALPLGDEETRTCSADRGLTVGKDPSGNWLGSTLWDLRSGRVIVAENLARGAELSGSVCTSIYFSADSFWLRDAKGTMVTQQKLPAQIEGVGVSRDGRYFDVHSANEYWIVDAVSGRALVKEKDDRDATTYLHGINMVSFPSGRLLVTTDDPNRPRVWDMRSGRQVSMDSDANAAEASVSTERILMYSRDAYWVCQTDGREVAAPVKLPTEIRGVSVSRDGQLFEIHTADELRLIDAKCGRTVVTIAVGLIQPYTEFGYARGFQVKFQWSRNFLVVSTGCAYMGGGGIPCFTHRVIEVFDDRQVTPAQLQAFVEAATGTVFTGPPATDVRAFASATIRQMTLPTAFGRFVRWSLSAERDRTITPTSLMRESEYTKQRQAALEAAKNAWSRD
jgi:WD40 repeat protein